MHPTKKLTTLFRDLVTLLEEESARNPKFAEGLHDILADLPSGGGKKKHRAATLSIPLPPAPDVFVTLQGKGETEFRFWLRSLDVPTLKSIIKFNGFDPAKASKRWTDPQKFVALVADQTIARMKRGSAFLPLKTETTDDSPGRP